MFIGCCIIAGLIAAPGLFSPLLVETPLKHVSPMQMYLDAGITALFLLCFTYAWLHSALTPTLANILGLVVWAETLAFSVTTVRVYLNGTYRLISYSRLNAGLSTAAAVVEITSLSLFALA